MEKPRRYSSPTVERKDTFGRRILGGVAHVLLYVVAVATITLFITNSWQAGHFGLRMLATALLLTIYYRVEALDVAFTTLRARDSDTLRDSDRLLLKNVWKSKGRQAFYEAREWLVILLVICLTFLSDFTKLCIPLVSGDFEGLRLVVSLLFTTLVVLWISQSPAKSRASGHPVAVMRSYKKYWDGIRKAGLVMKEFHLFEPGELISKALKKILPLAVDSKNLQPSQKALYCASLKRYGYSLHKVRDEIEISSDGSMSQIQTGLLYVVRGRKTKFLRWLRSDEPFTLNGGGQVDGITEVRAFRVRNFGQDIKQKTRRQLNDIFSGNYANEREIDIGLSSRFQLSSREATVNNEKVMIPNPKKADFTISVRDPLPEDAKDILHDHAARKLFKPVPAVALRYMLSAKSGPNSYRLHLSPSVSHDWIYKTFEFPCERCIINVTLKNNDPNVTYEWGHLHTETLLLETDHPLECDRIAHHFPSKTELSILIKHPMPGIQYRMKLEFRQIRSPNDTAAATLAASTASDWGIGTTACH